jgi:hypothetical protein
MMFDRIEILASSKLQMARYVRAARIRAPLLACASLEVVGGYRGLPSQSWIVARRIHRVTLTSSKTVDTNEVPVRSQNSFHACRGCFFQNTSESSIVEKVQ